MRKLQIDDLIRSWCEVSMTPSEASLNQDFASAESELAESDWYSLPQAMRDWLQEQDGLKIDGVPIESREELENAFIFLRGEERDLSSNSVEDSPIEELAFRVGMMYTDQARLYRRKAIIWELAVPLMVIIPRMCSACHGRVLDDAFPYFTKAKQDFYITRTSQFMGCGLQTCKGDSISLLPYDSWQDRVKPKRAYLENPPSPLGRADWSSFFCRDKNELDMASLPRAVQTRCRDCNAPSLNRRARWTIELIPRFVIPVQNCKYCRRRNSYFFPVKGQATVHSSILTRRWKQVMDGDFNPNDHPKLRAKIFGKTNLAGICTAVKQARTRGVGSPM